MNIYVAKPSNRVAQMIVEQAQAWKNENVFKDFKACYFAFCDLARIINNTFGLTGLICVHCRMDRNAESGEVTVMYKGPGKRSKVICLINF